MEIRLLLRRVVWINSTCFHEVRVVVEASRVCELSLNAETWLLQGGQGVVKLL